MTMSGMESASVQEAPLKAMAMFMLGWSGSRMRTSLPVNTAGACGAGTVRLGCKLKVPCRQAGHASASCRPYL